VLDIGYLGVFCDQKNTQYPNHAENRIYADRPAVKGCDAMITHKSASAANLSIKMRRYQTFEVSQTSKVYNRCGFSKIWVITACDEVGALVAFTKKLGYNQDSLTPQSLFIPRERYESE
jgi:hypothetical protein